ncbi:MAG: hypothetical protein DDT41_01616 [candidate division WS2 bacterium]|nr:hypothetical protein [Candidatus Psychracetigena formicireducens]
MVEILVAASIFFVLFTAVATTFALGINLQYRTELGTSAEFIAQFLLEYFSSIGPHVILGQPVNILVPTTSIEKSLSLMVLNLPYPEGAYKVLTNNTGTASTHGIWAAAGNSTPPAFVLDRFYRSEKAPHPQFFPNIFMIDGFASLPPGTNLTALNDMFPPTIRFKSVPATPPYFQIVINSFPPFKIAASPQLQYWIEVREITHSPNIKNRLYEITITVEWKIQDRDFRYQIRGLVPDAR